MTRSDFTERFERALMVAALESIAKNTCCDRCQEAALVAQQALARLTRREDGQPGVRNDL